MNFCFGTDCFDLGIILQKQPHYCRLANNTLLVSGDASLVRHHWRRTTGDAPHTSGGALIKKAD